MHPASRLSYYERLLARDVSSSAEDTCAQNLALLESLQFLGITRLLKKAESPDLRDKLTKALKGAPLAGNDSTSCDARSNQAELYFAAVLSTCGFAVEFAEPDLIVKVREGDELAVAVKRPRSQRKIESNLRKAAKQITVSQLPGLVAVDLSFVEQVEKPLYITYPAARQYPAQILLDGFALENEAMLLRISERPGVVGVLLHLTCVVRAVRPHVMIASRRWLAVGRAFHPLLHKITQAIERIGRAPV